MILRRFPPMGIYETLFAFATATGKTMGAAGTHPWAQGYPLTTTVPGGPDLPASIGLGPDDFKYPNATGDPALLAAIVDYYNHFYDVGINTDNVAVFGGARPAIFAVLAFLLEDTTVALEATEYTPYYDILDVLGHKVQLIPSSAANSFRPSRHQYDIEPLTGTGRVLLLKSNPCNPTGVTLHGDALKDLVMRFSGADRGALIDEAYEFFCDPAPESALRYIEDIDATNIFVIGTASKGLQVPGLRIGWVVAAREHIDIFRNYSSFGMGGVSRASQLYVTTLLRRERVAQARQAISRYYAQQRQRYGDGLAELGFELFTGSGGFYHWGRIPGGLTAEELNKHLFVHGAAILPGRWCDMAGCGNRASELETFVRFSFGPLTPESYDSDMAIMAQCVASGR